MVRWGRFIDVLILENIIPKFLIGVILIVFTAPLKAQTNAVPDEALRKAIIEKVIMPSAGGQPVAVIPLLSQMN